MNALQVVVSPSCLLQEAPHEGFDNGTLQPAAFGSPVDTVAASEELGAMPCVPSNAHTPTAEGGECQSPERLHDTFGST